MTLHQELGARTLGLKNSSLSADHTPGRKMPMVSLKRYLNNTGGESTLRQAAALLLEKLGEYAVVGDSGEFETFPTETKAIQDALTPDLPPENLLVLAGSATQGLETYNKKISRMIATQGSDFQAIIKMIEDSLLKIGGENAEFVQGLGKIAEDLDCSNGFNDLQSLKLHLGTCLSGFRKEIEREKTASQAMIERLRGEIEKSREPGSWLTRRKVAQATDPSANKPSREAKAALGREECIDAIQEA